MPNLFSTKIDFTGNYADLTDLQNKISEYTTKELSPSDFGKSWLGNILVGFGLGDKIESDNNGIRCRGHVESVSNVTENGNDSYFTLWTETVGIPMVKMWFTIINQYYGNRISIHWIAIDDSLDSYITNDIARFNDYHYYINWNIEKPDVDDDDHFDSIDKVVDAVNEVITNFKLGVNRIVEDDIASAQNNGQNFSLEGDEWTITCCILRKINDSMWIEK